MSCCLWRTELTLPKKKKGCLYMMVVKFEELKSKSIVRNVLLALAYYSKLPTEKINLISFKEMCSDACLALTQQWVSCMLLAAAASQLLRGCCLSRQCVCLAPRFQMEVTSVCEQPQTADQRHLIKCSLSFYPLSSPCLRGRL